MKIFEVGGTIRDEFLLIPNTDADYAVEAESYQEMVDYIKNAGGTIWQERPEFFSVRANLPNVGNADFTLCRKDGFYSDNRHPDNVAVGTIYDDLARRDFTMNAIARNIETGEIIDPFNGREDISYNLIMSVGNVEDRMNEDPLRMLRAIRFSVTKGMMLDRSIKDFLRNSGNEFLLASVTNERIYEELKKMFMHSTMVSWTKMNAYSNIFIYVFDTRGIRLMPTMKVM